MVVLPPGTLLQLMFLQERVNLLCPGRFIEIGPGSGEITNLLLESGWQGTSFDLETATVAALKFRFKEQIEHGDFTVRNDDFIEVDPPETKVDLVISCMVMEHLDSENELKYMQQAAKCLVADGKMIGLVPASPGHWGIEDDIAGHYRRYSRQAIINLVKRAKWQHKYTAGLTFPVSNFLLPVSNYLVQRAENNKLELSKLERTKLSGKRNVKFKTHFPSLLGLLLNKVTMLPLHWIQKALSRSKNALVLYFEASPINGDGK